MLENLVRTAVEVGTAEVSKHHHEQKRSQQSGELKVDAEGSLDVEEARRNQRLRARHVGGKYLKATLAVCFLIFLY